LLIITNGNEGEDFVKQIREKVKVPCTIIVFCLSVDIHSQWAKNYQDVKVTSKGAEVLDIAKQIFAA